MQISRNINIKDNLLEISISKFYFDTSYENEKYKKIWI